MPIGRTVREWALLLFNNNQKNNIEIISDGLSNQNSSKVDVYVKIDGQKCNINLSLKVGDVKQFGQVAGSDFDKQKSLWNDLLGIDISPIRTQFINAQEQSIAKSLELVYKYISDTINKKMSQTASKKQFLKDLGNGIEHHATRKEEGITLVQLSNKEAKIYKFNNVYEQISNIDLKSKIIMSRNNTPRLIIEDWDGSVFLEIRVKQENRPNGETYIRNYIEKGPLLSHLLSSSA